MVLVDLNGHSGANRLAAFSRGLAPVQVFHLGTPLTTGIARSVDYFIADRVALPPPGHGSFVEKIALLPYSYSVNSHRHSPPPRKPRALPPALRLANLDRKLDPAIWATWLQSLRRITVAHPSAVLWLLQGKGEARRYMEGEAASRGVSMDRLEVVERVSHLEHLRRVSSADLYLDTPQCNSVATAADLLWAGVPVVATPLDTLPSRGSLSLLHAVGHHVGVARNHKEYEDLVVDTVAR